MKIKLTDSGFISMLQRTSNDIKLAAIALSAIAVLPAVGQVINEDIKIVASDAAAGDQFGQSVAISDTTAIVGAWADDDAGSAYLFDTETGQELFKLTASDAAVGDSFGYSVAISGTTAIVGAYGDDDASNNSGSAYLFDTETGQQRFKLTADDAFANDWFGTSVAISGTTAIVGAHGNDDAGSVYLFDAATGDQVAKLRASHPNHSAYFGGSVAISGTMAIVGAVGTNSGSAYLFDTVTRQQLFKLTASDAAAGDQFGHSVGISGTTAIVGAFLDNDAGSNSGSAYIFDTATGQQLFKLNASDAAEDDRFGYAVAISGTTAIVGAFLDNDAGSNSGSVYLFDAETGLQIAKLAASDAAAHDRFGCSVAIFGTTTIVGAYLDDDAGTKSGSAYVFTTPTPCPADLTGDGVLNFFDISTFLTAFNTQNPIADFNNDGLFNFFDISAFLIEFTAGCP